MQPQQVAERRARVATGRLRAKDGIARGKVFGNEMSADAEKRFFRAPNSLSFLIFGQSCPCVRIETKRGYRARDADGPHAGIEAFLYIADCVSDLHA